MDRRGAVATACAGAGATLSARGARLRKGLIAGAVLVAAQGLCAPARSERPGGSSSLELEIVGYDEISESVAAPWVAILVRRPTARGSEGYTPAVPMALAGPGAVLPTEWERPVSFRWDFGDGHPIETGERPSLVYTFLDSGRATITVEAWSEDGLVARGSRQVTVTNGPPVALLSAVEIDPATATYELSALVTDAERDVIDLEWNFGDGDRRKGRASELWRVTHDYPLPGTYPVTVTLEDDDGGVQTETMEIVATGAVGATGARFDPLAPSPSSEGVATGVEAVVSGSLETPFGAEIRSMVGMHLGPVEDGSKCRFMFTAWDPPRLAHVIVIADLVGLPGEGGGTYTFRPGGVWMTFAPTAEHYEGDRQGLLRGFATQELGAQIGALAAPLPEAQRSRLAAEMGLDAGPREEQPERGAPAAASPFGLVESEHFEASGGSWTLTFVPFDRALGTFDLTLSNTDDESPYPSISLRGDFALDLEAARRDGMMLYDLCTEATFSVRDVRPAPDEQHVDRRPRIWAIFSGAYDVDTVDDETFQLTYPAAGTGEPTPVPAKLSRRDDTVFLEPLDELWGGVEYTVRIKTGEDGARGRHGVPLEDADGTGWHRWSFTTALDMEPGPGEAGNLSCHVLQTVRDAPLIVGKPAVARVYADWKKHPQVHESAQVEEFVARVTLKGVGEAVSDFHRFVRPDLWRERQVDTARAQQTANLFWTPHEGLTRAIGVSLEVPHGPGEDHRSTYSTRCVTPLWEHRPELTIDYRMLSVGAWEDEAARDAAETVMHEIAEEARVFAEQVFPLASVVLRPGRAVERPLQDRLVGPPCGINCLGNLLAHHTSGSSADVILGFAPQEKGAFEGGHTFVRFGTGEQGVVVQAIDGDPAHRDRFVFSVVHELGHVLGLDHLPSFEAPAERDLLVEQRNEAWASGGVPIHWHQGIEGFRIARDGKSGWNKSSSEGNAEGSWLTPLMFPATIPYRECFIARHQYLAIQEAIEERGGLR